MGVSIKHVADHVMTSRGLGLGSYYTVRPFVIFDTFAKITVTAGYAEYSLVMSLSLLNSIDRHSFYILHFKFVYYALYFFF